MRLQITDTDGNTKVWVAKTSRGFNKKQKTEIKETRIRIALDCGYHLSGVRHCDKCLLPHEV